MYCLVLGNKKPAVLLFTQGLTHLNFPKINYKVYLRRNFLKEEQIKILKTMNEATNRMDLNMFAQMVNLNPNQAITEVQELAREGFLRKVGGGFGLTEKGKNALKAYVPVSADVGFNFYVGVDKPLGFSAQSLDEFYRLIKQVCSDALEFHLYRGDFENWLREVCRDADLAEAFGTLKAEGLKGEDLRKALLKVIDAKYGIGELQ
jgi:predicted transcriptional regulator